MKFTAGCLNKALLVIFCILLGFVLCLGSIGLTGYILLTKDGMMGVISDKLDGVPLDFSDEVKAMSILDWGKDLLASVKDMKTSTIGDIEQLAGAPVISNAVEKMIGVPASIIQTATIDNLAETISSNLTMRNAKEKFGIEFPDMPIFNDEDFLNSPLSTALSSFNEYKLNQVISITEDSKEILKKLGEMQINQISENADSTIKSSTLGELMTINESSSRILQALKYNCIESQFETTENGDFILDNEGEKIYKEGVVNEKDGEGNIIEITVTLMGINEKINILNMQQVIEITETSNAILRKMRLPTAQEILDGKQHLFGTEDLLVNDLGGEKLNIIINTTTLGELINITEESEPIMQALQNTTIEGINAKIKILNLNEIFSASQLSSGALSLIPADTTLNQIPQAMTDAMHNATVATLKNNGIVSEDTFVNIDNMKIEQRAFIYNSNMGDLLSSIINFIADPVDMFAVPPTINYQFVSPTVVSIVDATFASLTDFVALFSQYNSLEFSTSITITVDEVSDSAFFSEFYDCYVLPVFNILTDGITINFVDADNQAVDVKFAVLNSDNTLSHNQCAYFYTQLNSTAMDVVAPTIEIQFQLS